MGLLDILSHFRMFNHINIIITSYMNQHAMCTFLNVGTHRLKFVKDTFDILNTWF